MSISNLMQENVYEIFANAIKTKKIDSKDIIVEKINDLPYPPPGGLPEPLVSNKILRTNATATDTYWGDIPHGTANQVLVTNPTATGPAWSDSLDLAGNIANDGSLDVGSNAAFHQNLVVDGTISAPIGTIDDLTSTSSFTDFASVNTALSCTGGLTVDGNTSLQNTVNNGTFTTVGATNLNNVNLVDLKLKLNGTTATPGQILQYDASSNLTFATLPTNANMFKVSRIAALANVNSTTNIFDGTLGGVSSTSYGSPEATINLTSGVVTLSSTSLYNISGTLSVDTHAAQGKLVFREVVSGTARFAQELDYVPALTTDQIIHFSFYYKPLAAGLTYEMVMIPYGAAGTVNILPEDATYKTTNCVMYVERKF